MKFTAMSGFADDVNDIDDVDAREAIVQALLRVANVETVGLPLEEHVLTGDLSDCYKVYVDYDPFVKPRWRLVYRIINRRPVAMYVQAVAAGERAALDAYLRASERLGREP